MAVCRTNHRSGIAEEALRFLAFLYEIEREVREQNPDREGRWELRQQRAKAVAEALRPWVVQ